MALLSRAFAFRGGGGAPRRDTTEGSRDLDLFSRDFDLELRSPDFDFEPFSPDDFDSALYVRSRDTVLLVVLRFEGSRERLRLTDRAVSCRK